MPCTRFRSGFELVINGGKGTTQLDFFVRQWSDAFDGCEYDIKNTLDDDGNWKPVIWFSSCLVCCYKYK